MHTQLRTMLGMLVAATLFLTACGDSAPETHDKQVNGIAIPELLPRKNAADTSGEYRSIRETYARSVDKIKINNTDAPAFIALASAYITEGRITGNSGYYSDAAIKVLNQALSGTLNPDEKFEALSLKSAVLLNMHQFRDALAVANEGVALNADNAAIYGALVDANVELGNYAAAVQACDKMLSIRPDLRSYSRASYLRQIYGENTAAIGAMRMAVDAGVPGMEQTEWARTNLGDLYFNNGNLDSASIVYRSSLIYRPGYPYAQMGMARVAAARKDYDAAIGLTKEAIRSLPESSFVSYLADLYELKGDAEKAAQTRRDVVDLLVKAEKEQSKSGGVPHNGNRELAVAYMNIKDYDKALEYAKKDYEMRPANIDANSLMAWLYFMKGDAATARTYAEKTELTKSRNATMLYQNALIYAKAGDTQRADSNRQLSMATSQYIDQRLLNMK